MAADQTMTDPPFSGFSKQHYRSHTQVYQQDIVNDFKRLVVQLADALDDEDSKGKIRYLHKDKLGPGGETMKALDVFDRLEEKGVFSARNVEPLETLLKNCDRCDLINTHLDPYRQKHSCQLSQSGENVVFVNKHREPRWSHAVYCKTRIK